MFNGSSLQDNYPTPTRLATSIGAVLLTIFLIFGLVCTAWILLVILRNKTMRHNVINLFIASLCVNDLINLVFSQTMVLVSYYFHGWVLGRHLCNFMPELNMVLVAVSLWHHALIALHRCLVVLANIWYKQMNKSLYTAFVLAGTRIFPLVFSLCLYFSLNSKMENEYITYNNKLLRCLYAHNQALRIFIVVFITIVVPCTVVVICFAAIFIFLRRTGQHSSVSDRTRLHREIRITKMFGLVFVMFLIGYFPYVTVRMFDKKVSLSSETYVMITVLYAGASCMNPIIFGAMNSQIREACLQILPNKRAPVLNNSSLPTNIMKKRMATSSHTTTNVITNMDIYHNASFFRADFLNGEKRPSNSSHVSGANSSSTFLSSKYHSLYREPLKISTV